MPREFRGKTVSRVSRLDSRFVDMNYVKSKFEAREAGLHSKLKDLINRQIKLQISRHRVVKALRNPKTGMGGEDLPAAFGLTADMAEDAASKIERFLGDTCSVEISKGDIHNVRGKPSLNFSITPRFLNEKDYEGKFQGEPFVYKSKPLRGDGEPRRGRKHTEIPWMKWVLNPKRADSLIQSDLTNIKKYGIVWDAPAIFLAKYSRSGRAIMLRRNNKNMKRYNLIDFKAPFVIKPRAGADNFIEEIATDKLFLSRLDQYVRHAIDRILVPKRL